MPTITLPATIHTPRLVLRLPRLDDAPAIFHGYAQDPDVTRYLTWQPHRSIQDTEAIVRNIVADAATATQHTWAIADADDALLGMITLRHPTDYKAEVGYVLARQAWGRGYMPEALRAVIAAAWTVPTMFRVWAVCDVDNPQSARVMEKVGMVREGLLQRWTLHPNVSPEPRDVWCYAITR